MTDTRPIRVALYARVSTSNHGQDVTLQTRELGGSLGKSLLLPMQGLVDWVATNWEQVKKAQSQFDASQYSGEQTASPGQIEAKWQKQ